MSPNGAHIVFDFLGDLYVMPISGADGADGNHPRRLTQGISWDMQPRFSPDGKSIAFTSDRDGYLNIYLMNTDGSEVQQVSNLDRPCALSAFGTDDDGNDVLTFSTTLEADVYRSNR